MIYEDLIPEDINKNIRMKKTCDACPEQYDMFYNNEYIGYFRLRHGHFSVSDPDMKKNYYVGYPIGDGCFDNDDERDFYLTMGKLSVLHDLDIIDIKHNIPKSIEEFEKAKNPIQKDKKGINVNLYTKQKKNN